MVKYTHPGDPASVRDSYRTYMVALKRRWIGHGRGHRCLRGLMKYRSYIEEYLAAKRLCFSRSAELKP